MASFGLKDAPLTFLLFLILIMCFVCSSFVTCARDWFPKSTTTSTSLARTKGRDLKSSPAVALGEQPPSQPPEPASTKTKRKSSPAPPTTPSSSGRSTFSVVDFGAKGDGVTDDTKAFKAAWAAACQAQGVTSKLVVPTSSQFLVGPVSFSGPCKSNIVFQLDGIIVAPTGAKAWGSGLLQWLEFRVLKGFTLQGQGTIEGKGSVWWSSKSNMPSTKPTAVRFYGSSAVTVTGIIIQNSPQCHLKFDSCQAVEVSSVTISSPGSSPNTDGIHLQNSVSVFIHDAAMGCGDDCISIQTGCSNVAIQNVNCGPGHGISIGGLGKDNSQASVSNVTVQNANFDGTRAGVRIKTWQGGSGSVSGVKFSNVKVSQVGMPVVIDQFYCDGGKCKNQTSAVAVSDVTYEAVAGTYTVQPVHLACSDSKPCRNLHLRNIRLQLTQKSKSADAFCWEAYGDLQAPTQPPITCLRTAAN